MRKIQIIDSHTGGEPTRVIVSGGPDLGSGTIRDKRTRFAREFDSIRSAVVNEPRGSDVLVGAMLCEPQDSSCVAGVIFFNNVGVLGMCGHGTIGLGVTLGYLGRIQAGIHKLETPVGLVTFEYDGKYEVSLENVPSYRLHKQIEIKVPGVGQVVGDVAWGGNWFFLVERHPWPMQVKHSDTLTEVTWKIRQALSEQGITGANGEEIDHIELFGQPGNLENHSRNFVLCPGKAYDRSPCGTGTSAKLACLAADGKLREGQPWRQESILGSVFEGSYRMQGDQLIPRIRGTAYITSEATLLIDPNDPFGMGIRG